MENRNRNQYSSQAKVHNIKDLLDINISRARRFLAGITIVQRIYFKFKFDILRNLFGFLFTHRYLYDETHFSNSFLALNPVCNNYTAKKKVPEQVFCFWTGDNEMSPARRKALDGLIRNAKLEAVLITPGNLKQFILEEFPLHPGYYYLSLVHKSDYLRCYFMHHYGGGYSDIKSATSSWQKPLELLNNNDDKWIIGFREFGLRGVAPVNGEIGKILKEYWYVLLGTNAYICKPKSPFTSEWYKELNNRMDYFFDQLQANPGNILGDNPGYPIPWTGILGQIFHPLCLKYHKRLLYSDKLRPVIKGHR